MSRYLNGNLISGVAHPVEPTRNLGQIIESILPQTDAGLHLLDGALIQGSGIYADFVTKIGELSSLYPSVFVTEADWQTSVNTYGVCGKFVYDSENNTARLPKITGIIEGTTDLSALGDLVEAGLPISWLSHTHTRGTMNITGSFTTTDSWGNYCQGYSSGAFTNWNTSRRNLAGSNNQYENSLGGLSFDASRNWSGSTSTPNYTDSSHNNSTVQPQTIKVFYYIVIATKAKTDIEVDIDEVVTDLNNKADRDGSNIAQMFSTSLTNNMSNAANIYMSSLGFPSNTIISLTVGASGTTYTAPANGWFLVQCTVTNQTGSYQSGYSTSYGGRQQLTTYGYAGYGGAVVPILKGQTLTFYYEGNTANHSLRFVYATGSESEAS